MLLHFKTQDGLGRRGIHSHIQLAITKHVLSGMKLLPIPLFYIQNVIVFQSIIVSFFPRQWLSVTCCSGRAPSQILGIPLLFLTTKTKGRKKKGGILEIQAYKIQGHRSSISFSLIYWSSLSLNLHFTFSQEQGFTDDLAIFTHCAIFTHWGYIMNLKQLLMNGLFQQEGSCVLNLMYIYVTESNQVGLCAITI